MSDVAKHIENIYIVGQKGLEGKTDVLRRIQRVKRRSVRTVLKRSGRIRNMMQSNHEHSDRNINQKLHDT